MKPVAVVIGANSMLGKELVQVLLEHNYRVIRCGRGTECEIRLDLEADELPLLPQGMRADALFHCAAAFGDDSWKGCRLNERVNALGSYLVAELAEKLCCEAVAYAGSISSQGYPERYPIDSYGASKARAEEILEWAFRKTGVTFSSIRLPQLYDNLGECCKHQKWLGRIIAYANAGKALRMPRGEAKRNFLHISDAARVMLAAVETKAEGRLAACAVESFSYLKIAELAYETFGNGGHVEIACEKTPFHEINIPDSAQTYSRLGFFPEIGMHDGLLRIKMSGNAGRFGPMDVE